MLIAVDHGNYSIKTPNFSFVAGLAEHTVRPISDDYLEYDGRFWTLTENKSGEIFLLFARFTPAASLFKK